MAQYLLAIHHAGTFPDIPFEEWRQSFAEWARQATVACRVPVEVRPFDERDIDELLAAYQAQ